MTEDTTHLPSKRGPIVISRHGRPALDRNVGPRLTWQEYRDWWARYEEGALENGQVATEALKAVVADADKVFASGRLRAHQTAAKAAPQMKAVYNMIFNEAPLPPPRLKGHKYLPKTWNMLARAAWMNGHSLGEETSKEAKQRAREAAALLHAEAADAKVYLAGHGWFNRMMRPPLKRLGWKCVHDGGDSYWSYRKYEYRP